MKKLLYFFLFIGVFTSADVCAYYKKKLKEETAAKLAAEGKEPKAKRQPGVISAPTPAPSSKKHVPSAQELQQQEHQREMARQHQERLQREREEKEAAAERLEIQRQKDLLKLQDALNKDKDVKAAAKQVQDDQEKIEKNVIAQFKEIAKNISTLDVNAPGAEKEMVNQTKWFIKLLTDHGTLAKQHKFFGINEAARKKKQEIVEARSHKEKKESKENKGPSAAGEPESYDEEQLERALRESIGDQGEFEKRKLTPDWQSAGFGSEQEYLEEQDRQAAILRTGFPKQQQQQQQHAAGDEEEKYVKPRPQGQPEQLITPEERAAQEELLKQYKPTHGAKKDVKQAPTLKQRAELLDMDEADYGVERGVRLKKEKMDIKAMSDDKRDQLDEQIFQSIKAEQRAKIYKAYQDLMVKIDAWRLAPIRSSVAKGAGAEVDALLAKKLLTDDEKQQLINNFVKIKTKSEYE